MRRTARLAGIATWGALVGALALAILFVVMRATIPSDGARIAFYRDGWSGSSVPWFLGTTVSDIVEAGPFLFHTLLTGPSTWPWVVWPLGVVVAATVGLFGYGLPEGSAGLRIATRRC